MQLYGQISAHRPSARTIAFPVDRMTRAPVLTLARGFTFSPMGARWTGLIASESKHMYLDTIFVKHADMI